jgi:hypothetical protein
MPRREYYEYRTISGGTMAEKKIVVPEVYSLEAEARLQAVRHNIELWDQRCKAKRGYPPRLVGTDEIKLYEARKSLERARCGLKIVADDLRKSERNAKRSGSEQFQLAAEFLKGAVKWWEDEVKNGELKLKQVELDIVSRVRRPE